MTAEIGDQAKISKRDVERLQECVAAGGVAVIPTDTVYGVCCDPDDERAARRLYELKGRPAARPAATCTSRSAPRWTR
jgi:L-threonylcarbamoyladenylate synthase